MIIVEPYNLALLVFAITACAPGGSHHDKVGNPLHAANASAFRSGETARHVKGNRQTQMLQTHIDTQPIPDAWALTTYTYDKNDRLLERVETGGDGPGGHVRRELSPQEKRDMVLANGHRMRVGLITYAGLTFFAMITPLMFWRRRPDEGRRTRGRRVFFSLIALAFVPLMAVGPETVHAATVQVMQAKAMEGVAAAAFGPATGPTVYTYTYDLNGNMTAESKLESGQTTPTVNTYEYDFENRLKHSVINFGAITGTTDYAYDADGIRKSKTVSGITTNYITDKNRDYAQVLEERDGAGVLQVRYLYGDDLISQTRGTTTSYYHYDGQMSTRQLTDSPVSPATAAVTDTYTYDAFGGKVADASSGTTLNNYLYTGEQYDPNAGFYYLRARYYDQSTGRLISRDTINGSVYDPMTMHKYLYCANNPINRVDPSGNTWSAVGVLAVSAITGALIGALVGGTIAKVYFGYSMTEASFWYWVGGGALAGGVIGYIAGWALIHFGWVTITTAGTVGSGAISSQINWLSNNFNKVWHILGEPKHNWGRLVQSAQNVTKQNALQVYEQEVLPILQKVADSGSVVSMQLVNGPLKQFYTAVINGFTVEVEIAIMSTGQKLVVNARVY